MDRNIWHILKNIWYNVSQFAVKIYLIVAGWIKSRAWPGLRGTIMSVRDGSAFTDIADRFSSNSWSEVVDNMLNRWDATQVILMIVLGLAFLISLIGGAGLIGSAIASVILALIIGLILATGIWLWQNLFGPIMPLVLLVLATLGFIIGAIISIKNYIASIAANTGARYTAKEMRRTKKERFYEENAAKKSYFFGRGQRQAGAIFTGAWSRNFHSIGNLVSNRLTADRGFIMKMLLGPFVWIYLLFHIISVMTFGSVLTAAIGTVHYVVVFIIMCITRVIFTIVWAIDALYLKIKGISSICPHCKEKFSIPEFSCKCGLRQHKLIPSSYGVILRKCKCGKRLPTTFLIGRSRLDSFCPKCGEPLVSSDSRQFGFTMVGASSAGKTAVITSFFHELQQDVKGNTNVKLEVPDLHKPKFDRLTRYFIGAESMRGTVVDDATEMYSLILRLRKKHEKIQLSLYDVAGEVFDTPDLNQIDYANDMAISQGIIFTLDPLSAPELKASARAADHAAVSEMRAVLNNFATFLHTLSKTDKMGQRIKRPLAVLITKMDSPAVEQYLSLEEIRQATNGMKRSQKNLTRDSMCRDFLLQIGLSDFIAALDAQFSNVHFYPVSATGGAGRGMEFKPSPELMEPFNWIIREQDENLAVALGIKKVKS